MLPRFSCPKVLGAGRGIVIAGQEPSASSPGPQWAPSCPTAEGEEGDEGPGAEPEHGEGAEAGVCAERFGKVICTSPRWHASSQEFKMGEGL
jgi:hypothetical protein